MKQDGQSLELFISKFLRIGILMAGVLMLAGWLSQLSFSTDIFSNFQTYHEVRLIPTLRSLFDNKEWGLLTSYAGLFVLICLPLLRVVMTLVVFLRNRNYILAGVSALVLLGLFLSVALGFEI